jgi:hypothetical protein
MTSIIYPLCYHETLPEADIATHECSDGLYVSTGRFRELMNADNDEMVVYRITSGDREVFAHVSGTHNSEPNIIYAPAWICSALDCVGEEPVMMERAYPTLGRKIKIKPHSTEYTKADDPVAALQHAFEAYSSIMPGVDLPLMVNGQQIVVSILETNGGAICIRGVELEVEIEGEEESAPVADPDLEAAIAASIKPTNEVIESSFTSMLPPPAPVQAPAAAFVTDDDPRFPGRGYRLGGAKRAHSDT